MRGFRDIKIDDLETNGLMGAHDSLAYRVEEIEKHFHNEEYWFGISGDQSGNDWAADTLNPFVATSGNGDYGADPNDEAKILGTDDTPMLAGYKYYDIHRVLISTTTATTVYKCRIVWDATDMATGLAANQYSEFMFQVPASSRAAPVTIFMPRLRCGIDKLWLQCKNATDNATISFFVGIHEYIG